MYINMKNNSVMLEKEKDICREADEIGKAILSALDGEQKSAAEMPDASPAAKKICKELQQPGALKHTFGELRKYPWETAYQRFLNHAQPRKRRMLPLRRMGWAALAAGAAAVVLLYVGLRTPQEAGVQDAQTLIGPGSRQAVLTLADGQAISINQADTTLLDGGVEVDYRQGVLSYRPAARRAQHVADASPATSAPASSQLVVPRGGENTVVLSDSTVVHLNAGARLVYPVLFVGKQRTVSVEGEAYFDVAPDKMRPFVVKTRAGDITVRGTSFNVKVSGDAGECQATLVSGKIDFTSADGKQRLSLLPGEQAVVSGQTVGKRTVDVDEYVGWVRGKYIFTDRPLDEIMRAFEEWYDIRVVYQPETLRTLRYSGSLDRYKDINAFLDALELTGDIRYRIEGNTILFTNE